METETPKPFSDDQKKATESRIESDADLLRGGAEIGDCGNLLVTEEQIEKARQEKEEPYFEKASVNGINFDVDWYDDSGEYEIYFPDLRPEDQTIRIGVNREEAKMVFDYARREAENEKDVNKLYKKVENFIYSLTEKE